MKIVIILTLMFFYSFTLYASPLSDYNEFLNKFNLLNSNKQMSLDERMTQSLKLTQEYYLRAINEYNYNDFLIVKNLMKDLIDKKEFAKVSLLFAPYYNMVNAKNVSKNEALKITKNFFCEMNISSIQSSIILYNSMNSKKINAENFSLEKLKKFEYFYNFNNFVEQNDKEKKIHSILCKLKSYISNKGFVCCPEHGYSFPIIVQLSQKIDMGSLLKELKDNNKLKAELKGNMEKIKKGLLKEIDEYKMNILSKVNSNNKKNPIIAILNFQNNSNNKELDPLVLGFSDILTTDLISLNCVSIVERNRMKSIIDELKLSEMGIVGSEKALELGKLLSVDKIFTGNFTEFFGRLRIDVKAINVRTGKIDDAWQVYGKTEEFFELEKKLVKMIARSLKIKISENTLENIINAPKSLEVALIFSKGLENIKARNFDKAYDCFVECSEKDRSFFAPSIHTLNMFYLLQIKKSLNIQKQ
jgi:TolB-like protein